MQIRESFPALLYNLAQQFYCVVDTTPGVFKLTWGQRHVSVFIGSRAIVIVLDVALVTLRHCRRNKEALTFFQLTRQSKAPLSKIIPECLDEVRKYIS